MVRCLAFIDAETSATWSATSVCANAPGHCPAQREKYRLDEEFSQTQTRGSLRLLLASCLPGKRTPLAYEWTRESGFSQGERKRQPDDSVYHGAGIVAIVAGGADWR